MVQDSSRNTCIVESKKLGKLCVNDREFTFSLTDETKQQARDRINVMKKIAPDAEKQVLEKSLALLDDENASVTRIPVDKVRAIGLFPYKDSKNESLVGISIHPEFAISIRMDRPFALIRVENKDGVAIERATPKSVKRARTVDNFTKLVQSTGDE